MSLLRDLELAFLEHRAEGIGLRGRFRFPAHLEVFEGHFPGFPMVPAVYWFAATRSLLERAGLGRFELVSVREAKFQGVVPPDALVELEVEWEGRGDELVARGSASLESGRVARFELVLRPSLEGR